MKVPSVFVCSLLFIQSYAFIRQCTCKELQLCERTEAQPPAPNGPCLGRCQDIFKITGIDFFKVILCLEKVRDDFIRNRSQCQRETVRSKMCTNETSVLLEETDVIGGGMGDSHITTSTFTSTVDNIDYAAPPRMKQSEYEPLRNSAKTNSGRGLKASGHEINEFNACMRKCISKSNNYHQFLNRGECIGSLNCGLRRLSHSDMVSISSECERRYRRKLINTKKTLCNCLAWAGLKSLAPHCEDEDPLKSL